MSSPACADGYDTPAQQREDSTTFMVAKVSSDLTMLDVSGCRRGNKLERDDDTERQLVHTLARAIVFIESICCL